MAPADPPIPQCPMCQECGCQTGGGAFCYQHAPYTVHPKQDGSFIVDRHGRKHVTFTEPPDPPVPAALDALLESTEFFEAMQTYRHVSLADPSDVVAAFEAVKTLIREAAAADRRADTADADLLRKFGKATGASPWT